jgi:tetratricopeptide (TPR) repeat protein
VLRWFLSYHSGDQVLAEQLEGALRGRGADVFFAPKNLRTGGYWQPALAEGIARASAFVLLVGEKGLGPWQVIEYYEALDRRVKEADFPVVLVLLEGQPAPGLPFLRQLHWIITPDPASEQAMTRLADAASGHGTRPGELWRYASPYRGLAAMTEADSDFFFGRERDTVDVLAALGEDSERLPILLGNSGVGKSSLAQAGVLAALKRQAWPDSASDTWPSAFRESRHWCFLAMKPGTEPLKALVAAFLDTWQLGATDPVRIKHQNGWIELLRDGEAGLPDLLDATEHRYTELDQPKPPAFFLYVDQGEELYVRSEEQQRRRFSALLAQGLRDQRLVALASMRSDFLGALQNDEPLYAVHRKIDVPPLREGELRAVVSRPAELLSARFETAGLAADIARLAAEESARDAGALPLLSYLLDDMWTQMIGRGDGLLRLPAQAMELGGVLAERANAFLARHPKAEAVLRRILTLKLATVREDGEPTRRSARRSEFTEEEWRLVSELADHPHRLVVTATPEGSEAYAEVAHEAIFRRWDKLRDWVAAEREFLVWRNAVEADRHSWEQAPESSREDALLMGLSLAQAQSWLARRGEDLSTADREFIELSVRREQITRRQKEALRRRVLVTAMGALLVVASLAILSLFEWRQALQQGQAAEQERDRTASAVEKLFFALAGAGKGDRTIAGLNRAINLDPSDSSSYLSRALIYYLVMKDSDRAAADLDQVIRLNPKMNFAYMIRAEIYVAKGDYDRALADNDEAISRDPNFVLAYWSRGNTYYEKRDYGRAIADFDRALKLDARNPYAYNGRGKAHKANGDYNRAIEDFEAAIRLAPKLSGQVNLALEYAGRGVDYFGKGEFDLAIADYDRAIALDPKLTLAYSARGDANYLKKDYERAIADYSEAITLDPKYVEAYNSRGLYYHDSGDYDRAIQDFASAIKLNPNYAVARGNLGNTYNAKGQYDRAIEELDLAIKLDPNLAFAYGARGEAYASKGEYDLAIANYDRAIALDPKFTLAYSDRGDANYLKKNYERAIADYSEAIALDPKYVDAYNSRGLSYHDSGDYDRAIQDFESAIKLDPNYAVARGNLGDAYNAKGQYDRAIEELDLAIKLDPNLALAYNARGEAYAGKGEYEKAIREEDDSIRLDPKNAFVWNGRCFDRAVIGRLKAALADCNESLRLDPDAAETWDSRAFTYLKLGELDKAIADYDAALRLDAKLAGSLYGRGIAKLKKGNAGGNADIDAARAINPDVVADFTRWGVQVPPSQANSAQTRAPRAKR